MSVNRLPENAPSMPDRLAFRLATREIARYAGLLIEVIEPLTEEQLWRKIDGIPNSIGTLVRHLTGNLNHYFGAGVLENGYIRDRDREFTEDDIPKEKMLSDLRASVEVTRQAAEQVTDEQLQRRPYRTPNGEEYESLAYHATRNAMHFALHYGQADYVKDIG
ncbi:MAG: DinB family protein [Anaerolineae bacterium]|nr:DinB family protein [Anaerolineae bacterium]